MKRWISGVCAAVLCLGGVRFTGAVELWDIDPRGYEVKQPSGEIFKVTNNVVEGPQPPFNTGTIIAAWPKGNDDRSYVVYLNEDGYWYYMEYNEVTFVASNAPDSNITVRTEEDYLKIKNSSHYIWDDIKYTISLNGKFMIDPLPDKVLQNLFEYTPFDMRETSQEEKDAMAAAIEAERERLGKNVTSVISDPGPEMFIYEPVETEATEESPISATEQPQTSVAAETAASASVPSQPTETTADTSAAAPVIAESPEDTGGGIIWIILLCSGAAIVAGVVIILLLQKKKKQTHIEAEK